MPRDETKTRSAKKAGPGTVSALNVNHKASTKRVSAEKYDAFRKAILKVVPRGKEGVPFKDLPGLVEPLVPARFFNAPGSCSWYTTTVKLDLEARGLLERVPGIRPQRLRKAEKSKSRKPKA